MCTYLQPYKFDIYDTLYESYQSQLSVVEAKLYTLLEFFGYGDVDIESLCEEDLYEMFDGDALDKMLSLLNEYDALENESNSILTDLHYRNKLYIESNNGGDYLKIDDIGEEIYDLEIGQSCVVVFKGKIHNTVLIALIVNSLTEYGYDLNRFIDNIGFDKKFTDTLKTS